MDINTKIAETKADLAGLMTQFQKEGRKVWVTSSFQTQSVPLLHLLSSTAADVEVLLIDTGFLFPETYAFAHDLQELMGFQMRRIRGRRSYAEQMTGDGQLLHTKDTDACCELNKVEPMDDLLSAGDVWMSGIRADQTATRAAKQKLETDARGVIRCHPMLNWTGREIYAYIRLHSLPKHPLEMAGYLSIGCLPCTRKWDGSSGGAARAARWEGSGKTECGLHLAPDEGKK